MAYRLTMIDLRQRLQEISEEKRSHLLRQASSYLIHIQRWESLVNLLTTLAFLEAKAAAGMAFEIAGDFSEALRALPENHSQRRILQLLEEAIRRDIHFISRHPITLFQCLWNSCWWYDCPDAAKHYVTPEGGWKPEETPWDRPGPRLCQLLESWRAEKEQATPGFLWLRSLRPPFSILGGGQHCVLRGHESYAGIAAVTPEGKGKERPRLFGETYGDPNSAEGSDRVSVNDLKVASVAVSADGTTVVSASDDMTIRVWDAYNGQQVRCLDGHKDWVFCVAISNDGRLIASGGRDETVRIWDMESGHELHRTKMYTEDSFLTGARKVAFSPDGQQLASAEGGVVRIWDTDTGADLRFLRGHKGIVVDVAYSREGHYIATGAYDGTARIWDANSGAEVRCFRADQAVSCVRETDMVRSVAMSDDGRRVATGLRDGTVKVWDIGSGEQISSLQGHSGPVNALTFTNSDDHIVSGSSDKTIRIWDAERGEEVSCLRGHEHDVTSVAAFRDDRRIASASTDNTVRIWNPNSAEDTAHLHDHRGLMTSMCFSADGRRLVTGSLDETVRVWDVQDGRQLHCLRFHRKVVSGVALSADGTRAFSSSWDESACVWDAENGRLLFRLRRHEGYVCGIACSADGLKILTWSGDATARLWDARTGRALHCLEGHSNFVLDAAFSPDGSRIATGSRDCSVRLWDAGTGQGIRCLRAGEEPVTAVVFSPGGSWIAVGSAGGWIRVWESKSGKKVHSMKGAEGAVTGIAMSSRGRRVVCSHSDGTTEIWDCQDGRRLCSLNGHGDVSAIALGPPAFPLRALGGRFETTVEDAATARPVAWYPAAFTRIATSPAAPLWAGTEDLSHLHLVKLEGWGPPRRSQMHRLDAVRRFRSRSCSVALQGLGGGPLA